MATRISHLIGLLILILVVGAIAVGSDGLPRQSPPLTITQPSGTELELSTFRGRVVVVEVLFVQSPHCLLLAETLNRLNRDLGPLGFQPVVVAFGPHSDPVVLGNLAETLKLSYPIGYTTADKVDVYLGRHGSEVLKIPQMLVIDRQGRIRASSGSKGNPTIENESSLRALIQSLLRENRPPIHKHPSNHSSSLR